MCVSLQVPNYLSWDEDSCGIPGLCLHIGAIQWFWDRVVQGPPKDVCNVLLVQTDAPEIVPHLMAWLHQPPNMVLLASGNAPLADTIASCRVALEAPPPAAVDHAMLQELASGFENGVPSWETLSGPRRQQQAKMMEERLRLASIQLYRSKVHEKALKMKEEEAARKAGAGAPTPPAKAAAPAAEPAAESVVEGGGEEEAAAGEEAEEPLTDLERLALQTRFTPSQAAVAHLRHAPVETLLQNVQDLLNEEDVPVFNEEHAAAISAKAKATAARRPGPRTKSTPRKKAPPTRGRSPTDPFWTHTGDPEAATSSPAQPSQQRSDAPPPVSAEDILLESLGLEEDPEGSQSQPRE